MIVIPMAGMSSRFAAAGYTQPKYKLQAHGTSLFAFALLSFSRLFASESFLFIYRDVDGTGEFIREECERLGVSRALFVALDAPTAGQAETVMLGLEAAGVADDEPITIFNIDTFRPGFTPPEHGFAAEAPGGYLEVFVGEGEGWSFVRPDAEVAGRALETAEKRRISDLCCTGLYVFRRAGDFREAYLNPPPAVGEAENKERYVAPLYNALIARGVEVGFVVVPAQAVIFCGVPAEYDAFLAAPEQARALLA